MDQGCHLNEHSFSIFFSLQDVEEEMQTLA
jgi:hypothetical protein